MRTRREQRGSAAVEFALVLPLVLVVVLGLVQVGVVIRDQLLVGAAARAGGRAAAVDPDPGAALTAAVAAAPGLDPALLTVEVTRAGARGDPVTVRLRYDDPIRVPLVAWLLGDRVTMHAETVVRQEFG